MKGFSSLAIHGTTHHQKSVNPPIYLSSTFLLNDDDYKAISEGRAREILVYSRYSNPTRRAVETKMAVLEGGEDCVGFASGLSAILATILAFVSASDHIITTLDLYGGTTSLFKNVLAKMGIEFSFVDPKDIDVISKAIKPNTKVLFFETLSNPLLKLLDVPSVSKIAKDHNIKLIVDNTFLTPYNLKPLSLGADIVVHSASKYINGHSDVIAGFSIGKKEDIDKIWEMMVLTGGQLDPLSSYLIERGIRTLGVRIERHNENALAVAQFLQEHPKVRKVIYPGLDSYDQHPLAKDLLTNGYGGMVSFEINGDNELGLRFMRNLKMIKEATSLGGVESLVSMPFNTSHAGLSEEERAQMGIGPGFIRLSCGIEDVKDIIEDLDQALGRVP